MSARQLQRLLRRFGICICEGLEPADGDDLVPGPKSDGEGAGPAFQDDIGAAIRALQRREDAAEVHAGKGGMEEVYRELVQQLQYHIVFARQRKSCSIYDFGKFFDYLINRKFSI